MCFLWIWEQTEIISLYNIHWLIFITETECVYCAVRTGSLYIIQVMCFVWIWEQTAIISLYSISWLVCITETECVYCAVRTGSLYIIQVNFELKGLTLSVGQLVCRIMPWRTEKVLAAVRSWRLHLSGRTLSQNTRVQAEKLCASWFIRERRWGSRQEHIEFSERLATSAACGRWHWKLQNTCSTWRMLPLGLWSRAIWKKFTDVSVHRPPSTFTLHSSNLKCNTIEALQKFVVAEVAKDSLVILLSTKFVGCLQLTACVSVLPHPIVLHRQCADCKFYSLDIKPPVFYCMLSCDMLGYFGEQITNTWKVVKYDGAGEGCRRSDGPIVWKMKKCYIETRTGICCKQ